MPVGERLYVAEAINWRVRKRLPLHPEKADATASRKFLLKWFHATEASPPGRRCRARLGSAGGGDGRTGQAHPRPAGRHSVRRRRPHGDAAEWTEGLHPP